MVFLLKIFIIYFEFDFHAGIRKLREKNARRNAKTVSSSITQGSKNKLGSQFFPKSSPQRLKIDVSTSIMQVIKIKLVKPEKVLAIENSLIQAAQQGKLRNRVSEQELVSMLESQSKTESKVTVNMG